MRSARFAPMSPSEPVHEVLGIPVEQRLLERWRGWYAPERQPFPIEGLAPEAVARLPRGSVEASDEERDTFFLYGGRHVWLSEEEFDRLPREAARELRRSRRAGMRPKPDPVWPSQLRADGDDALLAWVDAGCRPSRHREVPPEVWDDGAAMLPGARRLAGTFPSSGSGANCFATVLAAAGDTAAVDAWTQIDEFSSWVEERTVPVLGTEHDDAPGTVLVWTERGVLAHAAVTIGGGWALSKPSQSWSSPRVIWHIQDTILGWRFAGTRVHRYSLVR